MTSHLLTVLLGALTMLPSATVDAPRHVAVSPTVAVPADAPLELDPAAFTVFATAPPPVKNPVTFLPPPPAPAPPRTVDVADVAAYANGEIPRDVLCELTFAPGHYLQCDAAADLAALDDAHRTDWGVGLHLTDSYRTLAGQVDCEQAKGSLCATPGTSNHGWAAAVDLAGGIETFDSDQHAWMVEHAPDHGWYLPDWAQADGSKPEAWHWQHRPLIDALVAAGLVQPGA